MIRVLLINTVPTEKNGITGVIFNYLRMMDTTQIRFDLLSLNSPEQSYIDEIEIRGGTVCVIPRLDGTLKYWISLIKQIRQHKYDIIHIHGNSHTLVLELSAAFIAGCKVRIVHSHNTTCKYRVVHQFLKPVFNILYTHALACGEAAGKWMFGHSDFIVVNNGVDVIRYKFDQDVRKSYRDKFLWHGCKVIGHVGSFIPAKNQKFVVDIFNELKKKDDTYRLLLIGDGYQKQDVEEHVKQMELDEYVTFTGNIDNVADYLNAMDLVVMPSLFEGLPLTLIEQQANGLQCVVSDNITREVDKTENVMFLSLDEGAKKWAETISNIDYKNVNRINQSTVAIKKIIECGYSIQEEAKKLEKYYSKIIYK